MRIPTPIKKVRNGLMWIAAYEVWRLNTRVTVFMVKRIRAHKTDDNSWTEAVANARDELREEVRNGQG